MTTIQYKSNGTGKNLLLVFYPVGSQSSISYADIIGGTGVQKNIGDPYASGTITGANYTFSPTDSSYNGTTHELGTHRVIGTGTAPDSYSDYFVLSSQTTTGSEIRTKQDIPYILLGRILYSGTSGVHCCFGLSHKNVDSLASYDLVGNHGTLGAATTQNFGVHTPFNYILDEGPSYYSVCSNAYENTGVVFISGMSKAVMKPLIPTEYGERTA